MRREEAIKTLEESLRVLCVLCACGSKNMDSCDIRGCDNRDAIKALEQESILDKIRAEIEDLDFFYDNDYFSSNKDAMFKCDEVLAILNKYRTKSEVKE